MERSSLIAFRESREPTRSGNISIRIFTAERSRICSKSRISSLINLSSLWMRQRLRNLSLCFSNGSGKPPNFHNRS